MSEGMRRALTKTGRSKLCGLLFLALVSSSCVNVYMSGGGDGLVYRLMVLASAVLAPLSVFVLEWVFEVDRGGPQRGAGDRKVG